MADQAARAGAIRTHKMFGEYALYCNEKVVALLCDEQLFIKVTPASLALLDERHLAPPYPGAKDWLKVPEDYWDDADWISDIIRQTADSLPLPKPKTRHGHRKSKTTVRHS